MTIVVVKATRIVIKTDVHLNLACNLAVVGYFEKITNVHQSINTHKYVYAVKVAMMYAIVSFI